MSAAESWRPAPYPRAKPLRSTSETNVVSWRAKGLPKNMKDERVAARTREQALIGDILASVSNEEMAERFGSPGSTMQGAQLKAGGQPMTPGELAFLVPKRQALEALATLMRERVAIEAASLNVHSSNPEVLKLRMALSHIDLLNAILAAL
jgi:hypothetical protein